MEELGFFATVRALPFRDIVGDLIVVFHASIACFVVIAIHPPELAFFARGLFEFPTSAMCTDEVFVTSNVGKEFVVKVDGDQHSQYCRAPIVEEGDY